MKNKTSKRSEPEGQSKGYSRLAFDCKPGSTAVLYKQKEYRSASEALEAYLLDYRKQQQKGNPKSKYEKEMQDLLCPKPKIQPSSWLDHGKAQTDSSIASIVRESYRKLEEAEREKVQSSVSASRELMKRLENDRLPSPTRAMQPGGRLSTGSVDTNTLLDATPSLGFLPTTDTTARSGMAAYKGGGKSEGYKPLQSMLSSQNYNNNSVELRASGFSSMADDTLTRHSRSALDQHTGMSGSGPRPKMKDYVGYQDSGTFNAFPNGMPSFNDERQRKGLNPVDSTLRSIDKLEERANQSVQPHPEKAHWVDDRNISSHNVSALSMNDLMNDLAVGDVRGKTRIVSADKSQGKNGNGNKRTDLKGVKSVKGMSKKDKYSKHLQGSYMDIASGAESDGTTSSIITGHMNKGALPHKAGFTKASSTPKRGPQTKHLRFDMETSKSSTGQGTDVKDLHARPPLKPGHSLELDGSLDLSKVHPGTPQKATVLAGGESSGILKTTSPGRSRGAMSRVSFTTDDLLVCDPSGSTQQSNRKPRSKSLPRTSSVDQTLLSDEAGMHMLKNPFDRTADTTMDRSQFGQYSHLVKEDSSVRRNDTSLRDIKEAKYKEFLKGLMMDIDDSASSVVTVGGRAQMSLNPHVQGAAGLPDYNQGGGYLERIQKLLSGVPSMSEFLPSDDTQDSLTTEAVLEGDRPWEKGPAFKNPAPVASEGQNPVSNNMFQEFMAECMADAEGTPSPPTGLSGQPGPLEALKNMLFTVQSLGTSVRDTEDQSQPEETSETGDMVDLPLNDSISKLLSPETKKLLSTSYSQGAPSLNKAMEHLTKLKDLVHFTSDEMKTVDEDADVDIDDIL